MSEVNVTTPGHHVETNYLAHSKIAVDSLGNIYFQQSLNTAGYAEFNFGNITKSANGAYGFLAKLMQTGHGNGLATQEKGYFLCYGRQKRQHMD